MELTKMNKTELLAKCKSLGITKVSSKNKTELIELINASKTNNINTKININKSNKKKIIIEEDDDVSEEVSRYEFVIYFK